MTITIDGHQIPKRIERLIQENKWKAPADVELWNRLVPWEQVFQPLLYALDRSHGKSLWDSEAGNECLGVTDDILEPGRLDPKLAIIIGDLGPERLLALDLRDSKSNPPVCVYTGRENEESLWVEISANLDEFIDALGIDS